MVAPTKIAGPRQAIWGMKWHFPLNEEGRIPVMTLNPPPVFPWGCSAVIEVCGLVGFPGGKEQVVPLPYPPFSPNSFNWISFCRFTTFKGKSFCGNPQDEWVQNILKQHKDQADSG